MSSCRRMWRPLLFVLPVLPFGAAQCRLCPNQPDATTVAFPDRILPQMELPVNQDGPFTCLGALELAPTLGNSPSTCQLLQRQAAYCGCQGSDPPQGSLCSLCPDGETPTPNTNTTLLDGSTVPCQVLQEYLPFLTREECDTTERGQSLQRQDYACGCPSAQATCDICQGTGRITLPDRVVPFFNLNSGDKSNNQTCADIALTAAIADPTTIRCDLVQAQGGYCGCPDAETPQVCHFCPNNDMPTNLDVMTITQDTCQDLYEYVQFMPAEDCETKRMASIQGLAYVCGCPNVGEPDCNFCPDGSNVPNPDLVVSQLDGRPTCGQLQLEVESETMEACENFAKDYAVSAARCSCPGAIMPECNIQFGTQDCTLELLEKVPPDTYCECASFCDGEFVECSNYPGKLLPPADCLGTPIAGCNRALAESNVMGSASACFQRGIGAVSLLGVVLLAARDV